MPSTFYIDPVNGNDANDGLGWYKAAFTSGGTYEIKAGDTVTDDITAKTALVISVVVDSGTWAGGDAAGTLYVCAPTGAFTEAGTISVGANSNVATLTADFAVSSWKTWTNGATAARIAPGDTIRIAKSPDEVDSGVNGTFTLGSATVTLASALTKDICNCDSAWTASANVTQAQETGAKSEGTAAQKFTIATAFTTGKVAYFDLGENKDFSDYEKISLVVGSSADIAAGVFKICLCSDAAGDTPVDELTISTPINSESAPNRYKTILTIDKGSALGGSIRSIALYALSDPGAVAVYLDNIIACNDFSLNSLVGKSGGPYWPIKNITTDTTVNLGIVYYLGIDTKYVGVSETVGMYYRNPMPAPDLATAVDFYLDKVVDSGTSGNEIIFSGGWDTVSNEQDGMSYYDFLNGLGYGFGQDNSTSEYVIIENIGAVRASYGIYSRNTLGVQNRTYKNIDITGCTVSGLYFKSATTSNVLLDGIINIVGNSASSGGLVFTAESTGVSCNAILNIYGNAYIDLVVSGYDLTFNNDITLQSVNFTACYRCYVKQLKIFPNGPGRPFQFGGLCVDLCIDRITLQASCGSPFYYYPGSSFNTRVGFFDFNGYTITSFNSPSGQPTSPYSGWYIDIYGESNRWYSQLRYGNISDQITGGQNAAWAYGGEGICLYLNPDSTTLVLPYIFYCPVTASTTYQIHFQVKKTSAAANCTLEIDRISGCGMTEIKDESVTLTDSWAEHTSASFTPAYSGYVRCELHARDGSPSGDIGIDDIHLHKVS